MNKETKLKNYFLEQFKNSHEQCTEEMINIFSNYLDREYNERIKKNINNDFVIYSIVEEIEKLLKMSDYDIKKVIIKDMAFEEILNIRRKILNICATSRKGYIEEYVSNKLDEYINKLNKLQNEVMDFNKEEFTRIYNNCIIDIDYIKNNDIEIRSLELGRILES